MFPKTVLIVDDSATMRQLLRARIEMEPRLNVVGEASDPYEAREKIKALSPDVLTLDVEMPRMNGLDFLEKLMRLRPMPVVMVSTETHRGSVAAIEALALGAVECIGKPSFDVLGEAFEDLPGILLAAASARPRSGLDRAAIRPAVDFEWNGRFVLIGSSTGGVDALETLLRGFPENCPPTLIAQHMPATFLASFASRLDRQVSPRVQLASSGAQLSPGTVYLAPGGESHLALDCQSVPRCKLVVAPKRNGHRPSVDVLFESATAVAQGCVATILTGMGRDGARGMLALREAGARCLAQDESSSVVFGMPRAALEIGGAERVVGLTDMAREILDLCQDQISTATFPAANGRVQ